MTDEVTRQGRAPAVKELIPVAKGVQFSRRLQTVDVLGLGLELRLAIRGRFMVWIRVWGRGRDRGRVRFTLRLVRCVRIKAE